MNKPDTWMQEVSQAAARLVVDEGMDYHEAKHRAARDLGRRQGGRGPALPDNLMVEDEVRAHIALFCAESQAQELTLLREVACRWMQRMADFAPHVAGAVWRGTATRLSPILIDLYGDDPKSPEIALLNLGVEVESHGGNGQDDLGVLSIAEFHRGLRDTITLHFRVHDARDLRGALLPDSRGQSWRGNLAALQLLMASA